MAVKRTVFLVEDEEDIRNLVRFHLEQDGYAVREAESGEEALRVVNAERPALVLLDLMLPGIDGFEVCRRLRTDPSTAPVPIIILTARSAEVDRVLGLEFGADDYVTKPFSPRELVARVRAVLRIDFDTYEVFVDDAAIPLSIRDFELLKFFVHHPHRVYDRVQLLDLVWGPDTCVEPRTVDVHIRRLRKRIERDDGSPELILTVRGVGYKCNLDALGSE